MRRVFQVISWVALAWTVLPSTLYLSGVIDLPQSKVALLLATCLWFAVTPFWMGREAD